MGAKGTKVSQVIKTLREAAKPKDREAIEKSREEGMKLVALNMLKKNVNKNLISEVTGLSLEELDSLTCTCD